MRIAGEHPAPGAQATVGVTYDGADVHFTFGIPNELIQALRR